VSSPPVFNAQAQGDHKNVARRLTKILVRSAQKARCFALLDQIVVAHFAETGSLFFFVEFFESHRHCARIQHDRPGKIKSGWTAQ